MFLGLGGSENTEAAQTASIMALVNPAGLAQYDSSLWHNDYSGSGSNQAIGALEDEVFNYDVAGNALSSPIYTLMMGTWDRANYVVATNTCSSPGCVWNVFARNDTTGSWNLNQVTQRTGTVGIPPKIRSMLPSPHHDATVGSHGADFIYVGTDGLGFYRGGITAGGTPSSFSIAWSASPILSMTNTNDLTDWPGCRGSGSNCPTFPGDFSNSRSMAAVECTNHGTKKVYLSIGYEVYEVEDNGSSPTTKLIFVEPVGNMQSSDESGLRGLTCRTSPGEAGDGHLLTAVEGHPSYIFDINIQKASVNPSSCSSSPPTVCGWTYDLTTPASGGFPANSTESYINSLWGRSPHYIIDAYNDFRILPDGSMFVGFEQQYVGARPPNRALSTTAGGGVMVRSPNGTYLGVVTIPSLRSYQMNSATTLALSPFPSMPDTVCVGGIDANSTPNVNNAYAACFPNWKALTTRPNNVNNVVFLTPDSNELVYNTIGFSNATDPCDYYGTGTPQCTAATGFFGTTSDLANLTFTRFEIGGARPRVFGAPLNIGALESACPFASPCTLTFNNYDASSYAPSGYTISATFCTDTSSNCISGGNGTLADLTTLASNLKLAFNTATRNAATATTTGSSLANASCQAYGYISLGFWEVSETLGCSIQIGGIIDAMPSAVVTGTISNGTLGTSGTQLNVTSVTSGQLVVGATITGSGITAGTTITAYGTGTGGKGTYTVSNSLNVSTAETLRVTGQIGLEVMSQNTGPNGCAPVGVDGCQAGGAGEYVIWTETYSIAYQPTTLWTENWGVLTVGSATGTIAVGEEISAAGVALAPDPPGIMANITGAPSGACSGSACNGTTWALSHIQSNPGAISPSINITPCQLDFTGNTTTGPSGTWANIVVVPNGWCTYYPWQTMNYPTGSGASVLGISSNSVGTGPGGQTFSSALSPRGAMVPDYPSWLSEFASRNTFVYFQLGPFGPPDPDGGYPIPLKNASIQAWAKAYPQHVYLYNRKATLGAWANGYPPTGSLHSTAPSVTMNVDPSTTTTAQGTVIAWAGFNVTSCTGTNFTPSNIYGTMSVSPTATTRYSISCTGPTGSASANATVTVTPRGSTPAPAGTPLVAADGVGGD
jgi:hypothetical protein